MLLLILPKLSQNDNKKNCQFAIEIQIPTSYYKNAIEKLSIHNATSHTTQTMTKWQQVNDNIVNLLFQFRYTLLLQIKFWCTKIITKKRPLFSH